METKARLGRQRRGPGCGQRQRTALAIREAQEGEATKVEAEQGRAT